jgi:peptidoglycan hydrolase-like protein with peptidoglycan-binding domain
MMKEHLNKYLYWYIAGTATLVLFWFFFIRKNTDEKTKNTESADTNTEPLIDAPFDWSSANDAFPLKLGSMGDKVKRIQTWLTNVAGAKLKNGIDGKFGTETESALVAFKQRDNVSQDYWEKLGLSKL